MPSESSQQLPAEVWGSQIRGCISVFSTSPSWGLWYRWCSAHTACLEQRGLWQRIPRPHSGRAHTFPAHLLPLNLSVLPRFPCCCHVEVSVFQHLAVRFGGMNPVWGFAGSVLQLLVFLLMLALVPSPSHSSESPACTQDTRLDLVSPIFPDSSQCWSSCTAAAMQNPIIFMQQSLMTPRGLFYLLFISYSCFAIF